MNKMGCLDNLCASVTIYKCDKCNNAYCTQHKDFIMEVNGKEYCIKCFKKRILKRKFDIIKLVDNIPLLISNIQNNTTISVVKKHKMIGSIIENEVKNCFTHIPCIPNFEFWELCFDGSIKGKYARLNGNFTEYINFNKSFFLPKYDAKRIRSYMKMMF